MSERRTIALLVLSVCVVSVGLASPAAAQTWENETTPTGENLYGVENTANGTFAVGTGGDVLRRTDTGWETVVDTGPSGNSNNLYGTGVTDDGESFWFAGTSGAVGEYDVVTGTLTDYSGLSGLSTNNFNEVAVEGDSGDATVYIAGDSGKVYYSYDNGDNWNSVTPGSGASILSVDFADENTGHVVTGNKNVLKTTDAGVTWTGIGISDAGTLLDVHSNSPTDVWVSAARGTVYNYDGSSWENITVSRTVDLNAVDIDGTGYVAGGNGTVYRWSGSFSLEPTDTTNVLRSVARGGPDVAVGNSGTAVVRSASDNGSGDGGTSDGSGSNQPPEAEFGYTPSEVVEGDTVAFDASDSRDPDGSIESYTWTLTGSLEYSDRSGEEVGVTFEESDTVEVTLTVRDDDGTEDSASRTVQVQEADGSDGGTSGSDTDDGTDDGGDTGGGGDGTTDDGDTGDATDGGSDGTNTTDGGSDTEDGAETGNDTEDGNASSDDGGGQGMPGFTVASALAALLAAVVAAGTRYG